jgi:hypothetical protein
MRGNSLGRLAAAWGLLGVAALLGSAVYRLTPIALASLREPLDALHYAGYAVSLVFLGYTEGYKAFQKQFSPRVVARARYLARHPTPIRVLLAPLFCMGFFHATRKRLTISWGLSLGVVGLILLVSRVPQPWRGIVDAGVVVALGWGLVAMAAYAIRAAGGHALPVLPDVPEPRSGEALAEAA